MNLLKIPTSILGHKIEINIHNYIAWGRVKMTYSV